MAFTDIYTLPGNSTDWLINSKEGVEERQAWWHFCLELTDISKGFQLQEKDTKRVSSSNICRYKRKLSYSNKFVPWGLKLGEYQMWCFLAPSAQDKLHLPLGRTGTGYLSYLWNTMECIHIYVLGFLLQVQSQK